MYLLERIHNKSTSLGTKEDKEETVAEELASTYLRDEESVKQEENVSMTVDEKGKSHTIGTREVMHIISIRYILLVCVFVESGFRFE